MPRPGADQRGYSLLELVLVLGLAIILMVIAIRGILITLERYRLDSSASMIVSTLQDARINAIKRNRPVWVAIDLSGGSAQVWTTDPGGGPDLALAIPGLLPTGIAFTGSTPAQITFDSMSRPTTTPTPPPHTVLLEVVRSGQQKTVTVSPTGRATVS